MPEPKVVANGNVEVVVQLLPDAYAALMRTKDRDGIGEVDIMNIAVISYDAISAVAAKAGRPLSDG